MEKPIHKVDLGAVAFCQKSQLSRAARSKIKPGQGRRERHGERTLNWKKVTCKKCLLRKLHETN